MVEDTIRKMKKLGAVIQREMESDMIYINDELKISIIVCRCHQTKGGTYRWKLHLDSSMEPDITIAIRMDYQNQKAMDYYIIPALDVENPKLRLSEYNGLALDTYCFEDLHVFYDLIKRTDIKEAA